MMSGENDAVRESKYVFSIFDTERALSFIYITYLLKFYLRW